MIFEYIEKALDNFLAPVHDELCQLKYRIKVLEDEMAVLNCKRSSSYKHTGLSEVTRLPDGSAFAIESMPLPKDHWLYAEDDEPPPMGLRCGTSHRLRRDLVKHVQEAAQYAVRAATIRGTEDDFDPDALVQNMVVGLLGYSTPDGLSDEDWHNPKPVPLSVVGITRQPSLRAVDKENDQ